MAAQTKSDAETDEAVEHRWVAAGYRLLGVSALLLWICVGSYAWFRSTQPELYTVTVVGATLGIALAAELFGRTGGNAGTSTDWQSKRSRLLVGGCLVGTVVGSIAVAGSVEQLGASQPTLSTLAVVGGLLLGGSLLAVAARQSLPLAGFAAVAIVVSWASAPGVPLVETVVFGDYGIYGPLTRGAVTWIAPTCLLVGWWRVADIEQQVDALWNATVEGWGTERHARKTKRLAAGVGCAIVLAGWQTGVVGSTAIVGLVAMPIGLLGVVSVWAATRDATPSTAEGRPSTADGRGPSLVDTRLIAWRELAVLVGGPLGVITVVGIGYRLPVGTTLAAGCLCCLGGCVVRPFVARREHAQNGSTSGIGTVLDGSVVGCQLLSRVVVPVAVVGGSISLLAASGATTWLIVAVGWLSGGYPAAVVLVVAGGCVVLGALLPVVGGYAAGALLGVPLVRLLGHVGEVTAHLLVLSAVVAGWLLVTRVLGPP